MKNIITKASRWFLRFIQLQLFISLVSLPIVLYWGLPLSLLSPIGNLIFSPILIIFLLLSSLIFFCEIVHIPNMWLIYCLEKIISLWVSCMKIGDQRWLLGFVKPSTLFMISIPLVILFVLHNKKTNSLHRSILCFTLLLICSCIYLKCIGIPQKIVREIPCNNGHIMMISSDQQLTVIDPGVIGRRFSSCSWICYTLVPYIIKTTGKNVIDYLILLQPGKILFDAISELCTKIKVSTVYLIYWQGKLPISEYRSFMQLCQIMRDKDIRLVRITTQKIELNFSDASLTILPQDCFIKNKQIQYPAVKIIGSVENQTFELFSSKYKKR